MLEPLKSSPAAGLLWWALFQFLLLFTLGLLRGTFPLALILCLKASIKPTYTENSGEATQGRGRGRRMRELLLFDKAMATLCCVSIPLIVIPSRSAAIHSTTSSTCLFTYSPSSSPISIPSLLLTVSLSLIPWIILSILTLHPCIFCLRLPSTVLPSFSSFPSILLSSLQWKKRSRQQEAIQKIISNTGCEPRSKGEKHQFISLLGFKGFPCLKIGVWRSCWDEGQMILCWFVALVKSSEAILVQKFSQNKSITLNNSECRLKNEH